MTSQWPRRVPALSAMFTVGLNVVLRHPTAGGQGVQCGGYGSRGCAASHARGEWLRSGRARFEFLEPVLDDD